LLEDLAKITHLNDDLDSPAIKKWYFYGGITKMIKKQQEWSGETYPFAYIYWYYLKLTEQLWSLQADAFEDKELQNSTIRECNETIELLGLHNFWTEIESLRNKRQESTSFFTIERFSKYLQVIYSEILALKAAEAFNAPSVSIASLALCIHGERLLLLLEEQ
jgi:hypothetical protein